MRFLCLHGMGSNARVFEVQTAPLRYKLGATHQFEFVEEIKNLFPADEDYYAYFNEEVESFFSALADLDEYIRTEGPFDGIIGFSQGALLAATYLAHQYPGAEDTAYESIKCAVFICGSPPWQVIDGNARTAKEGLDGDIIRIPTVHIYGSEDPGYEQSLELSRICRKQGRGQLDHEGGHEIPRSAESTARMVWVIEDIIYRTLFVQ
ncbi:hypothetical protein K469DRAFT_732186 [Zopfia rhizophila CBS 207.26]|uniref:Serine hydrolase domain-containing protein n=1 Tax=Zopfia rhizophila CBS 207.26 TaxID=1314779 RepID=A0A6A6DEM6_9PEZI|nr:hypothetical protein K469DRAFT_732186 [Zopfia rhizophila CBS 207.26]